MEIPYRQWLVKES